MYQIEHICELFSNCTDIPIKAFDENYNLLGEAGHTKDSLDVLKNILIKQEFLKHTFSLNTYVVCHENNIIVLLVKLITPIGDTIYFLIGPFYVDLCVKIYSIPIKNRNCISYLIQFLSLIFHNILFDSSNNISYTPYTMDTIDYIEKNYSDSLDIDTICKNIKVSKNYLCSIFKKETGDSIITFLNKYRVEKSKELLKDKSYSILKVAISVGFQDQGYFCRTFKKYTGISPSSYRSEFLS